MTYLNLNAFFVAPIFIAYFLRYRTTRLCRDRMPVAIIVLATVVFDNLIVGSGIVAYDESHLSGIRVLFAPIEDFGYAIAVVPLLVLLRDVVAAAARKLGKK
ncbi:MAG: lycopene cyclase domain-containing protein [Micrococcales bacterium]